MSERNKQIKGKGKQLQLTLFLPWIPYRVQLRALAGLIDCAIVFLASHLILVMLLPARVYTNDMTAMKLFLFYSF